MCPAEDLTGRGGIGISCRWFLANSVFSVLEPAPSESANTRIEVNRVTVCPVTL